MSTLPRAYSNLAVVLYFTIPRAPSFTFNSQSPFAVDNDTVAFSRSPTNFSFTGSVNVFGELPPLYYTFLPALD